MERLTVSANPHIKHGDSTRSIMLDVILALLPAGAASVVIFGIRALFLIITCVGSAVVAEGVCRIIMKRPQTIGDLSAVVTGLLLAYNLPVTLPLWMGALGSVIAIVVVKQMFGGIGHNFVNPALIGRIVLMNSFTSAMTTWALPVVYQQSGTDVVTGATPLALMKSGEQLPSLLDMFLGQTGGCLGETCALALIIGGVYLVCRKVISPVIPLVFVGTVAVLTFFAGYNPLYEVLSGGLLLGAIFMATDYVTSPTTTSGKVIFAIGCGAITAFIRIFGSIPEGVSYSIIIMNILTPHINTLTRKKPFGFKKGAVK